MKLIRQYSRYLFFTFALTRHIKIGSRSARTASSLTGHSLVLANKRFATGEWLGPGGSSQASAAMSHLHSKSLVGLYFHQLCFLGSVKWQVCYIVVAHCHLQTVCIHNSNSSINLRFTCNFPHLWHRLHLIPQSYVLCVYG